MVDPTFSHSLLTVHLESSGDYFCAENFYGDQFQSADNGNTWSQILGISSYDLLSIASSGSNLFIGTQIGVLYSRVEFALWLADHVGFDSKNVYSLAIHGTNLYAGTELGIYKRPLSTMLLGTEDLKQTDPQIEIYPNPISSSAILSIKNLKGMPDHNIQFSLYNLFGCEVYKFVGSPQKIEFERNNLPSGLYFYQLKNMTEILQTGRIILD